MAQIPMLDNLFVGRGLNSATGKSFGVAIDFDEPQSVATGQNTVLQLVSIASSRELTEKLNINASASFSKGIGGISAEFSLAQSREFNSYYTYALVRVVVTNPPLLLRNPRLKPKAQELLIQRGWDEFSMAYGWEYIEGFITGGSYYALIEIQTTDEKQQKNIKSKLSGFYGPFSASGSLSSSFTDIEKNTTTNIFVAQSGGNGDLIEVSLEDMITQAQNFPTLAKQDPVAIIAITADYRNTVPLPQLPSPNSLSRTRQKNTLEDLGLEYLKLRDYKANLQFVLEHLVEFDDFRDIDTLQLDSKREKYQKSLELAASEIDEIVQRANNCTEDFSQCKTYIPKFKFLSLPKIGGDLMNLKQMEEQLAELREEIKSLKTPALVEFSNRVKFKTLLDNGWVYDIFEFPNLYAHDFRATGQFYSKNSFVSRLEPETKGNDYQDPWA
ncbi:MAG: hypothetical protein ACRC80_11505 [Waterburya sp.]